MLKTNSMLQKVSKANVKAINSILQNTAALGRKLGVNNIQQNRYMRDCSIGAIVGVDKMNQNLHGWDGVFKNGVPFENKNIKATCKTGVSFSVKFQDTSLTKLAELKQGVIVTNSFWGDDGKPAFILLGNTRDIGDYLEESYNPDSRRSSTVSMSRCINRGFKLIAGTYTPQQVIDTITAKFPKLGDSLKPTDIYREKDAISLVGMMM